MFPPECVDEKERLSELPGFDQEACAIDFPFGRRFSHVSFTPGGRENEKAFSIRNNCRFRLLSPVQPLARGVGCWLKFCLRASTNLRAHEVEVNSQSLVQ
jgi:hypothetical protein